ncbi:MAG: (d)CMP kinase [Kiritimatiellae bacterium]|nr:(d)CMP kinase [Kiritimatiellia bacterium]
MNKVIAVDGPSGSGKSSVSKAVGKKLGFLHVDSGALYRIMTYLAIKEGVDTTSPEAVQTVAEKCDIELKVEDGAIKYYIQGRTLGDELRTPEINANASYVARVKEVRDKITELLRSMTKFGDIIVEGRDITTVVFPDTPARFFLTASAEARAARRQKEEVEKGIAAQSAEEVKNSLLMRDKIDSSRKFAPLRKADGVIEIDSSNMTLEESIEAMLSSLPSDYVA